MKREQTPLGGDHLEKSVYRKKRIPGPGLSFCIVKIFGAITSPHIVSGISPNLRGHCQEGSA
jgi:hypothetical protein